MKSLQPVENIVLLGFATTFAQALLLRESMAAMGGSELSWGTVMALWLVGMSIGSRIGVTFGSLSLTRILPTLVLVLTGVGVILFRAAPALVGAAPGESITTFSAAWLWIIAIVPTAIVGGIGFPSLAEEIGGSGGGRAYAFEAVGAFGGGVLLSLALLFLGTAAATSLGIGLVAAITQWRRNRTVACILLAGGILLALPSGEFLARASWRWAGHPGELRSWLETRFQRIDVAEGTPTTVYADGHLLASYPDPYTTLPSAHLFMLLHPEPNRVLAIGSVADGSIEAMVQHPVEKIVVVEEDPELLRKLPLWYGSGMAAALSAPQVQTLVTDPLQALNSASPWDLIILRDGDPTTLRRNRTRTLEFFRRCRSFMNPDGLLVVKVAVPDTYLGGAGGRLLSVLAQTLREVFPRLSAIPGEEIMLVAGGPEAMIDFAPKTLTQRLTDRGLTNSELLPEMIPLLLDPDRARVLLPKLLTEARPNTIRQPRAVMLAGSLHEGRSRPSLVRLALFLESTSPIPLAVILGLAVCVLLLTAIRRRSPGVLTAAVVGFCSIGWWLVLVATWQSTRGSVYSEIGTLTAAFMGGLAGGAAIASRWQHPARLPIVLAGGVVLSILVTGGIAVRTPLLTIPLLLITGGLLTGAAFPGVAFLTAGKRTRRGAGIAFAADEAGAAIAALVVGILTIPWAGLAATAAGLAILQIAAIPAVVVAIRRA